MLDRSFRLRPGVYEPRFQWWDAAQRRWRDPESDAVFELQVERECHARELQVARAEEQMEMAIAALHFLPEHLHSRYREQIVAYWRDAGSPPDVMDRILKVQQAPDEWRSLLEIPDGNGDIDSR